MNDIFDKQLYNLLGVNKIKKDEAMKNHTTFRIGGPADYFVTPESSLEIQEIIGLCKEHSIPFYIIGNGSNLLVGDKGFRGLILQIGRKMEEFCITPEGRVTAQAGVMLSKLSVEIANKGFQGFEFAAGIPGTLGGAVTMNAGAYGGEIKDHIVSCTVIDTEGRIREIAKEEMNLSYRKSIVLEKGYIVTEAFFQFERGKAEEILSMINELNRKRKEKQPLNLPSAGSTFKRPEGYFAGKLIEDAGLRGFSAGDAKVSEKHCGFVVNTGEATAQDVCNLIEEVKERVYHQSGVLLEPEVRMLGEFL